MKHTVDTFVDNVVTRSKVLKVAIEDNPWPTLGASLVLNFVLLAALLT